MNHQSASRRYNNDAGSITNLTGDAVAYPVFGDGDGLMLHRIHESTNRQPGRPNVMKRKKGQRTTAARRVKSVEVVAAQGIREHAAISPILSRPLAKVSQWLRVGDEAWHLKVKWRPELTALKTIMLNRAGNRFQNDDCWVKQFNRNRAKRLIDEGSFVPGKNALLFVLNIGNSHLRAILLGADPRAQRWSGFALAEDGCWCWHSWVVRSKDHRLIETTAKKFILYFGVREPVPARHKERYATLGTADLPQYNALFGDE